MGDSTYVGGWTVDHPSYNNVGVTTVHPTTYVGVTTVHPTTYVTSNDHPLVTYTSLLY